MGSNAFLLCDPSYQGPVTVSMMGGCYVEDNAYNDGKSRLHLAETPIEQGTYSDNDPGNVNKKFPRCKMWKVNYNKKKPQNHAL